MDQANNTETDDKAQKSGTLEQIYSDAGTGFALDLFERFDQGGLSGNGLKNYLDTLPPDSAIERAKLDQLMNDPRANVEADLSTRSGQLVWAAGLGHVFHSNASGTIRSQPIWKILTGNSKVSASLGATARFIDLSATNRNATMDWGTPGSWFWFSPDKNHINIDLFNTLISGFGEDPALGVHGMAHASGVMMHEIGHSQLTTRFTDKMIKLHEREQEILETSKNRKLTKDEFKTLARTRTEFSLRMNLMNAAEDNCVNQYAANCSGEFPHDFGASLNICNVILQGSGLYLRNSQDPVKEDDGFKALLKKIMGDSKEAKKKKEIEEAGEALAHLGRAIALSFYATNGLFDKSDIEAWKSLGVNPDDIKVENTGAAVSAVDYFLESNSSSSVSDFDQLLALNIGPNGMANLQPQSRDRWLLRSVFARSIETYADRRCRIVDEIWDKYAAQHAKILIDAVDQNSENKMTQKQQENSSKNEKKDNDQGDGQGSGQGDGQSGNGSPSQQDSEDDSSPSRGETSPSSQGSDSGNGEQKAQENGQGGGEASSSEDKSNADKPQPSQGNDSGNGEQKAQENTQGGGEGDCSPTGEGDGASNSVDVEDVGKMDLDDKQPLPSTPAEARNAEHSKNNKHNEDLNPDQAKRVRDLAREAKQQGRQNNLSNDNTDDENASERRFGDLNMEPGSSEGGREKGLDLASLAQGDWCDFRKRINELEPVIRRVANDSSYIRDCQKQTMRGLSKRREMLPRGNNLRERLDMTAHMNMAVKRATGQKVEERDLRRWKMDEVTTEPTSVELWILCDGSGSMKESLPGGGRRIDSAVQSMAILFEANRRAGFNVFAGMWGDEILRVLAAPGDRDRDIGNNFQRIRDGINSGTQLSPAIAQAIRLSAKQETGANGKIKRFVGMTHFLILSDGDLYSQDIDPLVQILKKLFRDGPSVSIDIAILGNRTGSEMDTVVNQVKRDNPAAAIDIIRSSSAKDIPVLLSQKIKSRIERSAQDIRAIPDTEKREAFARVDRAIRGMDLG